MLTHSMQFVQWVHCKKMTFYFDNCIYYQNCNCAWHGFKGWCKVSPCMWQPSMGNVGNTALVEYNNNWNSPLVQRSLPLIGHFNHIVITLGLLWYQTNCIRHLPGSWSRFRHWQSWEHPQGHYIYNCIIMEIFMPWWQQVTPSQMLSGAGLYMVVNPRRACAARVTVLGLCVCVSVSTYSRSTGTKPAHQRYQQL